jgi:transposase
MKTFKDYSPDQRLLLPPDLQDWLPQKHLARFISDVVDELDLSAIFSSYDKRDGRGAPPYHPRMMVKLLLYGYCIGIPSSRRVEEATYTDVAFRVLAAGQHPDHASIAEFRKRHLEALAALFKQVLRLCDKAGLVKLGHVAIDGTKVKANASKHKAMSYERMEKTEKKLEEEIASLLEEEIAALLERAERVDAAEDEQHGANRRGDELPEEFARRESRLKVIREAKEALEEEAREQAREKACQAEAKLAERQRREEETGKKMGGRKPTVPDVEQAKPDPKAQRNFTDPDSRIMVDGATKAFGQGYNGQAAVDRHSQIILAAEVTQEANDKQQLVPMARKVLENTGQLPEQISADSGYFSETAVTDEALEGVDLYVAVARQKHGEEVKTVEGEAPADATMKEQMGHKLKTEEGKAAYALRKGTVEPVFGQIKGVRGFRQFLMRGLEKVRAEWRLICLTHNLLKLFGSGRPSGGRRGTMGRTQGAVGVMAA